MANNDNEPAGNVPAGSLRFRLKKLYIGATESFPYMEAIAAWSTTIGAQSQAARRVGRNELRALAGGMLRIPDVDI